MEKEFAMLIGRIVKVNVTIKNQIGELIKVQQRYGRIVEIDINKRHPYLIEYLFENGTAERAYASGWAMDVIR